VGARVAARQAVRYDISYDPERDRWYLDASWKPLPNRDIDELWTGGYSRVESHDGTIACVCSMRRLPIGEPLSIGRGHAGLRASRVTGGVRRPITICSTMLNTTTALRS